MIDLPKKKPNYRYILSFGSNLGEKHENCQRGLKMLSNYVNILKISSWLTTPPLESDVYGNLGHQDYLNFVLDIETNLNPNDFYFKIVTIEDIIGHNRERKWLPREIDIDILLWADNTNTLFSKCKSQTFYNPSSDFKIPHEGILKRDFLIDLMKEDLNISHNYLLEHCQ